MDKCLPDGPDELTWHLAEIKRMRAERAALHDKDRAAWEEQGRQISERWGKNGYVSFIKGDPDCLPDDYRYADICPPHVPKYPLPPFDPDFDPDGEI